MSAISSIVESRQGYTLNSVLNDVDFNMLSQIIGSNADKKAQTTTSGVHVTPGHFGVDPGNAPVKSLKDFAKQ
ncbi:phage tail tape measure protein [Pediococcus inopinatus]|uniref:phage tail tape measure protein n=1 Tax=Pediococcus inopinatus TaxID=114090 RepID=UPI000AF07180|nr:phage tail tape measure protein [Pediococcus inopinatus]